MMIRKKSINTPHPRQYDCLTRTFTQIYKLLHLTREFGKCATV